MSISTWWTGVVALLVGSISFFLFKISQNIFDAYINNVPIHIPISEDEYIELNPPHAKFPEEYPNLFPGLFALHVFAWVGFSSGVASTFVLIGGVLFLIAFVLVLAIVVDTI